MYVAAAFLPIPFGLQMLIVGIAALFIGPLSFWMINSSAIKIHEGAVCVSGHHFSYAFWIILEGLIHSLSAMACLAVTSALVPESPDLRHLAFGISGILTMVLSTMILSFSFFRTIRSSPAWETDIARWHLLVSGQPAAYPGAQPRTDAAQDVILRFDRALGKLFEERPQASTVAEFESMLVVILEFRARMLDIHPGVVRQVLEGRSYRDPDERREWLERGINQEVWDEINRGYRLFAVETILDQNEISGLAAYHDKALKEIAPEDMAERDEDED